MSEETEGRWQRIHRAAGGARWLWAIGLLLCLLIVTAVAVINGRPFSLALIRRLAAQKFPAVRWLDREELTRWRADSSRAQPVLLDARTQVEYALSHLPGAARIDPRQPSLKTIAAFPRDTPVVVYCSVGYRSARVAQWLGRQGFRDVYDLAGGLFAWANEDRPMEADGRAVTRVHPYNTLWGRLLEPGVRADAPPVTDPLSLP